MVRVAPSSASSDTLLDRLLALRDRLYSSPSFHAWAARIPLVRSIARSRAQALFDLTAGFVYSQTLVACSRLDLFERLSKAPMSIAELAAETGMAVDGMRRLVEAAKALELLADRSGGRIGLGALGGPVLAQGAIGRMVDHNALLYEDLADPLSLLGRSSGAASAVGEFFPYAEAVVPQSLSAATVERYSNLMAQTVSPIALEVIESGVLARRSCLLDVGGGQGAFLAEVGRRYPRLALRLFDLPVVADRARATLSAVGMGDRFVPLGGDFHRDPLPQGADAISFVRVLLDHDDVRVHALLSRARTALPRGGVVIVAEPMTGVAGARRVGDVYFAFYLRSMGRGRCRSVGEHRELLAAAGFRKPRLISTRYPVFASVLVAEA